MPGDSTPLSGDSCQAGRTADALGTDRMSRRQTPHAHPGVRMCAHHSAQLEGLSGPQQTARGRAVSWEKEETLQGEALGRESAC